MIDSSIVSAPAPGPQERRRAERYVTLLQVARVIPDTGPEQLCLIRNIGPRGMLLETHAPLACGTRVRVEPKFGNPVAGSARWSTPLHTGIAFDDVVDVGDYLRGHHPDPAGLRPRAPRIFVSLPARLKHGANWYAVEVLDLSQGGAKVTCPEPLTIASTVMLEIGNRATVGASVRWNHEGRAGLRFVLPVTLAELATWTAGLAEASDVTRDVGVRGMVHSDSSRCRRAGEAEYHLSRADEEQQRALAAQSQSARIAHLELSELHRAAAQG